MEAGFARLLCPPCLLAFKPRAALAFYVNKPCWPLLACCRQWCCRCWQALPCGRCSLLPWPRCGPSPRWQRRPFSQSLAGATSPTAAQLSRMPGPAWPWQYWRCMQVGKPCLEFAAGTRQPGHVLLLTVLMQRSCLPMQASGRRCENCA
jgi:hypothetical protein